MTTASASPAVTIAVSMLSVFIEHIHAVVGTIESRTEAVLDQTYDDISGSIQQQMREALLPYLQITERWPDPETTRHTGVVYVLDAEGYHKIQQLIEIVKESKKMT